MFLDAAKRPQTTWILDTLQSDGGLDTQRLCAVCAEVTGATGAGIMLMSGDVPRGSLCSTDAVSALIEQLQYDLGEGPCVDAYHQDRPVAEADLADPAVMRWLVFTAPAVEAGARAVLGFPLQVGAVRLGALNLYRDRPGPLTDGQHADAVEMADISATGVLTGGTQLSTCTSSARSTVPDHPPGRRATSRLGGGHRINTRVGRRI